MSRTSKARRDARKRAETRPVEKTRRALVFAAVRSGERAALRGDADVVPPTYANDPGLSASWHIGYHNERKAMGGRP